MTTLTPQQITDLRRLLAEATPGPWYKDGHAVHYNNETAGYRHAGSVCDMVSNTQKDHANAALISAAINALPSLLDAAEREAKLREALRLAANRAETHAYELTVSDRLNLDFTTKEGCASNLRVLVSEARAALGGGE